MICLELFLAGRRIDAESKKFRVEGMTQRRSKRYINVEEARTFLENPRLGDFSLIFMDLWCELIIK